MNLEEHVPLGPLTTYRVGGAAALFARLEHEDDLRAASAVVEARDLPVLIVGKGSNLLVADAGFPGLAVVLGDGFATVDLEDGFVRAGGATPLPVLARRTAAAGRRGLEWAVGVPGSVGGAVRMNAGGHGSDIAAHLLRVRVFDLATGDDGVVEAADLALGYRRSSIGPTQVVVWADLATSEGDPDAAAAAIAEIVAWRRENQPGGQNAGSVFTNPEGDSAGRLVEAAGCKGLRLGTAEVSTKHANFIQADPGGSADDVLALIHEVRRRVREASGIELQPELRLVGFPA
ncbi:MAG TPA: UDP-N-acetylmuramate dehydrogenase [Acidimicrobiales bacterium]|nr:UDP-N-acetylmuramate dehydrogenase [Acidimicrobiales bacterium]